MKAVAVSCVGKLKEKFFADAAAEYAKRLQKFCRLTVDEVPDVASADEVRRESDALQKTFRAGEYRIVCDVGGELVSSEELSRIMQAAFASGKSQVRFVVGGSAGVDDRVRAAADKRVSFGRVTYPHQLMRVILLEQVYRAFTIAEHMPYHK
ncbi:MAG: 23S rRNA (pseudouridine(1915)-N(3))-methyltransferase RlmH [Clostridia bacterium]|jgi:23S rRNA (pseudouridine1915-N3)-methyltransferase|nr:23S rRNA (pseudouridine(1915)-N(3))-methyltransferase RlmH [Clostridia bacterium]